MSEYKFRYEDANLILYYETCSYSGERVLYLNFYSISEYNKVFDLNDPALDQFKIRYTKAILEFTRGKMFNWEWYYNNNYDYHNKIIVKVKEDTNVDLVKFHSEVKNIFEAQYRLIAGRNELRRKATNSREINSRIEEDIVSRGCEGFDEELPLFKELSEKFESKYDISDWIEVRKDVKVCKTSSTEFYVYFGRYAEVCKSSNGGFLYSPVTIGIVKNRLEAVAEYERGGAENTEPKVKKPEVGVAKSTKTKPKVRTSKSKKSKSEEVDHGD